MLNLLKIVLTGLFLVSTMVMTAEAGPRKRGVRTARGIKSGEITKNEAKRLSNSQKRIANKRERFSADGEISKSERIRLRSARRRQSRQIYRTKHNEADRN